MIRFLKIAIVAFALIGSTNVLTSTQAIAGPIETGSDKSVSGLDLGSGRIWDWWG